MTVTFAPQSAGSFTGNVTITSNASNATLVVPLSGTGITPGQLSVTPTSVSFVNVEVGTNQSQSVTLTNSGGSTVSVTQASVTGTGFSLSGLSLPLTLPAGQSASFNVWFTPQAAGTVSGNLAITSNASNSTLNLPLSGAALAPGSLTVNPTSMAFASVQVGNSQPQSASLTNTGGTSITISKATVSGTGFSLSGLTLPLTLAAGQSTSMTVTFAPQSAGSFTGNVTITSNAPNATLVVPLSGTALAPGSLSSTSVFFGVHQAHYQGCDKAPWDFPLFDVPAGAYRDYGACDTLWAQMNPASGSFEFKGLDTLYSALYAQGVNDVFIVLGNTPTWISSNPTDGLCDQANEYGLPPGMCDPPSDLNADGTGTDLAWRSFVTALLQHVTASGYSSTHAHIQMYEIWDEFQRSDSINDVTCTVPQPGSPGCTYRGTFAQMLRMTQDLRCIVEGHASDPITALNTTCGQDPTMPARGLDPTALVTEGDAGGEPLHHGNQVMQNYLYCNNSPPAGSLCNYGDAGSASTDIISGHSYFTNGQVPEDLMSYIAGQQALLSSADAAKPYITGEGSWGHNVTASGSPAISDPGLQAAMVTRWYMALLMLGVNRGYWYAWDESQTHGSGGLWSPTSLTFPPLECTETATIGGFDCTGDIAYRQTVNWIAGATVGTFTCPGSCTNPSPGVFTLNLTRAGGYQAQILWDSTAVSSCANVQCGSTAVPPLSFTAAQWRDLGGNTHTGAPADVGAAPVIIENMPPPS
jgi:hypothetical protein